MTAVLETQNEVYTPFIESDASAPTEELSRQVQETGYLFFRGLVPEDEVLATRRDVLELCAQAGWLDPSRDLMDAIAKPGYPPTMEGRPDYMPVYRQILRLPRFHAFPTQPSLLEVAAKLLQISADEVFTHPRRIGRVTFPHLDSATTPAHQDHFYIRGSVDTYSCWIPLGECPQELGGLAVLPGSQKRGFLEHTVSHPGAVGGRGVPADEPNSQWHCSDFGVGDALFFYSFTIHKALPNLTEDRLRISTDNRYQRPKDDVHPDALKPHFAG